MRLRDLFHRLVNTERGNAAVELALAAPVLLLMVVGLVDFGRNLYGAASLENAARTGVQYAQLYPGDGAGIVATVRGAGGVAEDATVNWQAYCVCPDGTPSGCSATCSSEAKPLWLISVTVSQPFRTVIPYTELGLPTTINGNAVIRVR